MRKLAAFICILCSLVLIGGLAVIAPASGGQRGPRITQLSHDHPQGEPFSFFCGKIAGVPGQRYFTLARGPNVQSPEKDRFRMPSDGRIKITYTIGAPGRYTMILKKAGTSRELDRDSYTVPPPPPNGAAVGPFHC